LIRKALRQVIFMRCLYHVGTTVHAIIEDRTFDQRTPDLDHLEVATLLLDLCECGALRVDRGAPTESRHRPAPKRNGLTIFDNPRAGTLSPKPTCLGETVSVQQVISALQERAGPKTPRFFANHNALERFLKREKSDDEDFLFDRGGPTDEKQAPRHANQEQEGCSSDEDKDVPLVWAPF
jgi:hypothetical protein